MGTHLPCETCFEVGGMSPIGKDTPLFGDTLKVGGMSPTGSMGTQLENEKAFPARNIREGFFIYKSEVSTIFPGFSIRLGSSAFFMDFIILICTGSINFIMAALLLAPIPCSPESLPPNE